MAENSGAGGFIIPSLPSPAPSMTPSAASTLGPGAGLPHPRAHALRAGSVKEDQVRHWVSERLDNITRRFVKKAGKAPPGSDDVEGYKTMGELCADLESVIHIVWLSGTPNLQIPYLLNIASEFNTWAAGFPPLPAPTFAILRKLDHCFASLLSGEDIDTHEALPGFENGLLRGGMSRTDMVRCKSTVERARFLMVEVMNRPPGEGGRVTEEEDGVEEGEGETTDWGERDQTETGDEGESGSDWPGRLDRGFKDEDEERLFMDVARVYENTLVKLGETLGDGSGVGDVEMFAD